MLLFHQELFLLLFWIEQHQMTVTNMPTADIGIQEVWQSNLEEEFRKIRNIVQKYPYVAMVFIQLTSSFLVFKYSFLLEW